MLEDGARGIQEISNGVVDGEDEENTDIEDYPGNSPTPMSQVICKRPDCPLSQDLIIELEARLNNQIDVSTRDMTTRHLVWQIALGICQDLQNENGLNW